MSIATSIAASGLSADLGARWEPDAAGYSSAREAEARLAQLAASVGPLRHVLAAIAARLVGANAWERLCYARLSDYARERPGCSARQIQELARVHRALAGLPEIERALLANVLPWSKLRLLVRVATPEDEAAWIERARLVPTRQLEQEVRQRAAPGSADEDDAEPTVRVVLRCSPAVCEKWSLAREVAERVAGQRVRSDEALELVVAEASSAVPPDSATACGPIGRARGLPSRSLGSSRCDGVSESCSRSFELPADVVALGANLDAADAFELDRRLRLAVRLEQTLDAAIAPLLRRARSADVWSCHHSTLAMYAREQLGMSVGKARSLLRLERAADRCPELRSAFQSGRLSWVKARILLPLLLLDPDGQWRPIWVAWAERVTVRRLAQDVERALLLQMGHTLAWLRCKFDPSRAQDAIPPEERQLCARGVDVDATQRLVWNVPREVAALFYGIRGALRSRLGSSHTHGELFAAMLDLALETWLVRDPSARRPDPVFERDGYRCVVPGCTSRRNLQDHHIEFRSAGGSDAPDNRVALCAFHHHRCLHAGLLGVSGRAPDQLVFELGRREEGPPLARYRSGDIAMPEPVGPPGERSRAA
jgi:hypothetical protein